MPPSQKKGVKMYAAGVQIVIVGTDYDGARGRTISRALLYAQNKKFEDVKECVPVILKGENTPEWFLPGNVSPVKHTDYMLHDLQVHGPQYSVDIIADLRLAKFLRDKNREVALTLIIQADKPLQWKLVKARKTGIPKKRLQIIYRLMNTGRVKSETTVEQFIWSSSKRKAKLKQFSLLDDL